MRVLLREEKQRAKQLAGESGNPVLFDTPKATGLDIGLDDEDPSAAAAAAAAAAADEESEAGSLSSTFLFV
jgi:hypothetical protein